MTREERIKYCQCCLKRKDSAASGLICSLTGAQATFEGGCEHFEEDPVAMKEHFYSEEERKNSRYASIESLFVGLAICSFAIPYMVSVAGVAIAGEYSLFGKMLAVTGSFTALGAIMILALFLSRKMRKPKTRTELADNEMFKIIQEEGYFPHKECDGDIVFTENGMVFSFGKCANGFVYGRLYYKMKQEEQWLAMQAAQYTEVSFVAIKVLVVPQRETLLFSVESLCDNPESFRTFVKRSKTILSDSAILFHKRMNELEADGDVIDGDCENESNKSAGDLTRLFPNKALPS